MQLLVIFNAFKRVSAGYSEAEAALFSGRRGVLGWGWKLANKNQVMAW